jgi:formylglycine-generating enzyme required for sulfatase activity
MRPVVTGLVCLAGICVALVAVTAETSPPLAGRCSAAPAGMTCIAGGPFLRGSDDGPPHARPQQTVWIQTFYMDSNEVTYADYKACVKEGKCRRAGPNYGDFNNPLQPITGINWYDAVNYCKVRGKHLPTEAEWEKAARGTDGRMYSWGNEPASCDRMIYMNEKGRSCGVPKAGKHPEKGRPEPVGSRPPGVYGLFDMAGNSWEWVYDWYSKSYSECGADCEGVNPRGPCDGAEKCQRRRRRVVRGGSWYWEAEKATSFYRRSHVADNKPFHHFGFRCAADIKEASKLTQNSI